MHTSNDLVLGCQLYKHAVTATPSLQAFSAHTITSIILHTFLGNILTNTSNSTNCQNSSQIVYETDLCMLGEVFTSCQT